MPNNDYEAIIIGGGIAGLQAAIQLGRYRHRTAVIDHGRGRSALCKAYHNILGWPDGISGEMLRTAGRKQAEAMGVRFIEDEAVHADRRKDRFSVTVNGDEYHGDVLLIATGIMDRYPQLPGLESCAGQTIYVCPDCDGYEVIDRRTAVLGSGDSGAGMALELLYWTRQLTLINHERKPISAALLQRLQEASIPVIDVPASEIVCRQEGKQLDAIRLADGTLVCAEKAFIAFGGNEVRSGLAGMLGAKCAENGHIWTDPRSKETSIKGVWAAGDIGIHSEQVTIAMGEGAQAAIWMHKALLKLDPDKTVYR